jgi:hypothetical protein
MQILNSAPLRDTIGTVAKVRGRGNECLTMVKLFRI